ncbi:MAG: hypothetical protein GY867_07820, partial [bacterium]|nr:hypothetical protein [bacterium]
MSATGDFMSSMTSLTPGTLYYVRAYATNEAETSYGSQVSFTADELAIVTTGTVTAITQTTATGNGNITDLGVPNPTAHGVVWNTSGTPTTSNSSTDEGAVSAVDSFTSNMTGLTSGTPYYVRAYATNEAGTSYGNVVGFTASSQPTVSFSSNSYSVAENAGSKTITVVISGTSNQTITVQYAISNGTARSTDYTSVSGTLTFSSGDVSKSFNVVINNDNSEENNETVNLALSNPINATLGSPNSAVLTITDDDDPEPLPAQPQPSLTPIPTPEPTPTPIPSPTPEDEEGTDD